MKIYHGIRIDPKDQPDYETKRSVLEGWGFQQWDYLFSPPPVDHSRWDTAAWITYIGENWFRTS